MLPVALALMAGVAAAHWVAVTAMAWLAAIAAACVVMGAITLGGGAKLPLYGGAVLLSLFLGGLLGALSDPVRDSRHWVHGCSRWQSLVVQLKETPQPSDKTYRVRAEVEVSGGEEKRGDIMLYLKRDSAAAWLRYGDRLRVDGWADTVRQSLYSTGKHYAVVSRDSTSLRARSEALRMRLLRRMLRGPLEAAGVAEALALGWKADIAKATRSRYRDAGLAHLLAVSGLHVGLLAVMAGWCLVWTGKERKGRVARGSVQLAAVWGFALLTGMAPSMMRAALMFSLFIVSDMAARRTSKLNLLAAAAILMLVCKPMLLYDVGWQLSFSAVGAILLAQPAITALRIRVLQTAAVSTAATLGTLPVVLSAFHRLPVYFLIANVVVVPMAGVVLAGALAYMAVPCEATARPLGWALQGVDMLTGAVQALPGAVVDGIHLPALALAGVAVAVLAVLALPQLFRKSLSSR